MNVFEKLFMINNYHAGLNRVCKISSILNFIQEITIEQVHQVGSIKEKVSRMFKEIEMFVLSVRIELQRPVYFGEVLTLRVYQCPLISSKLYRKAKLYIGEEYVGSAVVVTVLVNLESRKLINPRLHTEILEQYIYSGDTEHVRVKEVCRKKVENIKKYHVEYSDIDRNGHMNNVRYAEIISNVIKMEQYEDQYINKLQIDFISECYVNDEINLGKINEGNKFYVQGSDSRNRLKFKGEAYLQYID